jgi:hypothetical protein
MKQYPGQKGSGISTLYLIQACGKISASIMPSSQPMQGPTNMSGAAGRTSKMATSTVTETFIYTGGRGNQGWYSEVKP